MKMAIPRVVNHLSAFFLFLLLLLSIVVPSQSFDDDCVYTVYIRTGKIISGGTDSIISLRLYDPYGDYIEIPNLEAWGGLMKPGHNYFERGNLDIFSGLGGCLRAPVCAMRLTSDGTGSHPGWYVNYVEVTSSGSQTPCFKQLFKVDQWLALDTSPHTLTAYRSNCPYKVASNKNVNLITVVDAVE